MGKLSHLVIHCTDTPEGRAVTSDDIRKWHTAPKPKGNGWSRVGYYKMIHLDGTVEILQEVNDDDIIESWEITNGARGYNSNSKHVVYVGGCDKEMKPKDTRTQEQLIMLRKEIMAEVHLHPYIIVTGHNQISSKACPAFDVPIFCKMIGIPEKNIFKNDEGEN